MIRALAGTSSRRRVWMMCHAIVSKSSNVRNRTGVSLTTMRLAPLKLFPAPIISPGSAEGQALPGRRNVLSRRQSWKRRRRLFPNP
jgi:hypothetical protein